MKYEDDILQDNKEDERLIVIHQKKITHRILWTAPRRVDVWMMNEDEGLSSLLFCEYLGKNLEKIIQIRMYVLID